MSQYFSPYRSSGGSVNVELKQQKLSSYATKTDLKNVTHVDVGSFALKSNLASLKTAVGAIKLTENNNIDKYKYLGYGTGFDSKGTFTHPSGGIGQNVINFGADMSSSAHANNKTKANLMVGEGFTQGLNDTTLYAEKMHLINFTATKKKCLSLQYNGDNSYWFVNGTEIIKFKAKNSEIVANPLCLGNISEDFSVTNMKKTGLYGCF